VPIANDILYMDFNGNYHLLSATNDLGEVSTSDISQRHDLAPFIRSDVNLTNIRRAVGVWSSFHSEAWFFMPQAGASVNNLRIVVQFQNPQIGPRFFTYRRDVGVSLWMRPSGDKIRRPAVGDDVGFVWLLHQDVRTKDGAAYVMELETAATDFGFASPELAYKVKNGAFIELVADLQAPTVITITPIWDSLPTDPIIIEMGTSSVGLGTFQLDLHALGAGGVAVVRRKLSGSGRTLKLRLKNDRALDEVRLAACRVMFTVGDERTKQT
jgi:hypothetical protein